VKIASAKDLIVYKKAYALGMRIFEITKCFPPEERYALTGQLRRSGRSPCRSLREAWAKRRYRAHFISKLTDADGENGETDTSLDFTHDGGYITGTEHAEMTAECAEIGRMLGAMIKSPDKFLTSDL
jgi:four helix bundle protein